MSDCSEHHLDELDLPAHLRVPAGQVLLLQTYGEGAQIYTCPDMRNPTSFAVLRRGERAGAKLVAIHYGGLIWEATDGSVALGDAARQQRALAPDSRSIPWLLIPVQSTGGSGLLSRVTFILRIKTQGGRLPAGRCGGQPSGAQILIPYSARYYFYVETAQLT